MSKEAVILVGHGGVPSDFPKKEVEELKKLEAQRRVQKVQRPNPRESELNEKVRNWPRTPETEPYKFGLEAIAKALEAELPGKKVVTAYNEFCHPSLEGAIESLAEDGYEGVSILTTMYTRGGVHSETEIPEIVQWAKEKFPSLKVEYAWPFESSRIAAFLVGHLKAANK